jgi:hypothetical protein
MPFIPVANTVEVVFNWDIGGHVVKNIMYAEFTSPPTPSDMTNLATAIIDEMLGTTTTHFSAVTTLLSLTLNDLTTISGATLTAVTGSSGSLPRTWGGGGTPLPNNSAFVTTLRTGLRGRSYRGRLYIPGAGSADLVDEANFTGAAIARMVNLVKAIVLDINGVAGWTAVVVSRHAHGAPRPTGVVTPILNVTGFSKVGTQRRRMD